MIEMADVNGGALADDGAELAAKGIVTLQNAGIPGSGGFLVGLAQVMVGDVMFYGGWLSENRYMGIQYLSLF